MTRKRSVGMGLLLLPVCALIAGGIAASSALGRPSVAADTPYLVVDRFDAVYDGDHTTSYKVTASSWENRPLAVTWTMQYPAGRCGTFTIPGAAGNGSAYDRGNVQGGTVPLVLGSDGYYTSTASYDHEACPFPIESNEVLTVEVVRTDVGAECRLTYVQRARDNDEPSVPQVNPKTTAVGTCSFSPPPTTTSSKPPSAPPPTTPAPKMTAKEKQEYKEAALIAGASGATFGGATIALVEFPPAAAISLMGAGVCFLVEAYNGRKALDPPDPSYKGLATPRFPEPTLLRAAGGITAGEAAAANALLTNTARMVGLDRAFLTSLERAQGAYAARDLGWLRKQSAQASKLARAEAKTLDARPGLEQAVGKAMAAARHTQSVTAAQVRAAQKAGLPRALVALLRSFGVNASELATFRRQLASVSPATVAGPVSSKWGTPALARAERTTAKLLRTLAGRLDKSSKG